MTCLYLHVVRETACKELYGYQAYPAKENLGTFFLINEQGRPTTYLSFMILKTIFSCKSGSRDLYKELCDLSPSQFELFVAEHFKRMEFDVKPTGPTSFRDGGIDLVAIPKRRTVGSCLLAIQVKHHRQNLRTGREAVDRLLAWKDSHFRVGILVTNTGFTRDAQWVACRPNSRPFIRLRDFEDLTRWIRKDYWSQKNWREIPHEINLAPGSTVAIPSPKFLSF
jgi:hypothetical protein